MSFVKVLLLFSFLVFTAYTSAGIRWLLNQPSDLLLVAAGLSIVLYAWIAFKTKAFTKNPFSK